MRETATTKMMTTTTAAAVATNNESQVTVVNTQIQLLSLCQHTNMPAPHKCFRMMIVVVHSRLMLISALKLCCRFC